MPRETQFDIDETLQRAGEAFWAEGYEATSMSALLKSMGIQKGSFYNTYGSKHEVYLRALEQYSTSRLQELREFVGGKSSLEAIREHFEMIYEECVGPSGFRGCLIFNCALERAHTDREAQAIVKRAVARHEALLAGWIREGQANGEIPASLDAASKAKGLMAFVVGMRVYSRSGADPQAVRTLLEQAMCLLDGA
ncbi:MAG: TetR/AcrR family transcriptional regulator [Acidobacteriota bacterium]